MNSCYKAISTLRVESKNMTVESGRYHKCYIRNGMVRLIALLLSSL